MPEKFIRLTDQFYVSPQISLDDVALAAEQGFTLIVSNRPDGEMPGQPPSAEMEAAAKAANIQYAHIPIDGRGLSMSHISALKSALNEVKNGKALAFCASGTRSVILRSYSAATEGRPSEEIIAEAAAAGFNISPHAQALESLAARTEEDE